MHLIGFEIVPRTLQVGDYVLSPEICVGERTKWIGRERGRERWRDGGREGEREREMEGGREGGRER